MWIPDGGDGGAHVGSERDSIVGAVNRTGERDTSVLATCITEGDHSNA